MKPIRVQRKRTKGWKMPENTVYVGRPTIFGNPFKVGETYKLGEDGYIIASGSALQYVFGDTIKVRDNAHAVELFKNWIAKHPLPQYLLNDIEGQNLACFCPLDKPCHADVLLELANN